MLKRILESRQRVRFYLLCILVLILSCGTSGVVDQLAFLISRLVRKVVFLEVGSASD